MAVESIAALAVTALTSIPDAGGTPAWRVLAYDTVGSTNDVAAQLSPWQVVLAASQTQGRGRRGRSWVADRGGIWLSAVLPTPAPAERWSVLPLAAGWALRETLASFGVAGTRLRWPNDLMVGRAKLAGILVERFRPDTAVIGLGLNYTNEPAVADASLAGAVVRLADLAKPLPSREEVLATLLAHFALAQRRIEENRVAAMLPALNAAWHVGRVLVTLQGAKEPLAGTFLGVTELGCLRFADDAGATLELIPSQVELLREIG